MPTSGASFTFSEADVQAYLESPAGVPYLLTVEDDGILATNLSGTTSTTPLPYVNTSGGTMTGPLYGTVLDATTVSGASIFDNNNRVITDVNSQSGPSVTLTTTNINEGTNLYYTEARVNANTIVSGHSISIDQNTTNILTVSGITVTNANNISQNTTSINNVSGVAATAIQSGVSLGGQTDIFSAKNGTNLEFNTVAGAGNVSITTVGNVVTISGTGDGNGDVVGPSSATNNAITIYDGTTGKLIKDSSVIINPSGVLNANVISGTTISGNNIFDSGNRVVTSVNSQLGPSVTLTTTNINEGTNLYYTDARVNANTIVSGHSISIAQNTTDITNVSGVAFTAIQSGTNLGAGDVVFAQKNGTNLEFKTLIAGENTYITTDANTITISGADTGGAQGNYAFAYDTTTQTAAVANTFQDITLDNNGIINGWSHTLSGANFTCPDNGFYEVSYSVQTGKNGGPNVTNEIVGLLNGTEIPGSQGVIIANANNYPFPINKTFSFSGVATQNFKLQFASTATNAWLTTYGTNASTANSVSVNISRI